MTAAAGDGRQRLRGPVLVVDDDESIREVVAEALGDEGFEVITASSGREALARLASSPAPAVILLDLMMPEMNGWEFREAQLRDERLARVPVVLISAHHQLARAALVLRVAGYLPKPVSLGQLIEAVDRAAGT